jgi:predicted NUDIX family NTP pyrophosphohydrolase
VSRRGDSAGLVIWRRHPGLEFLLVHPGGPYWRHKDDGAWSIPKGELDSGEDPFEAARRETREETGFAPSGRFALLRPVRQPSGKVLHAWTVDGDFDPQKMTSTSFEMEWPPRSGKRASFPECDRAAWFAPADALRRITIGQRPILEQARRKLGDEAPSGQI